jgi:hypothetical protein
MIADESSFRVNSSKFKQYEKGSDIFHLITINNSVCTKAAC